MDVIGRSQTPHGWTKLEDLGRDTRIVMNTILRPSHHLMEVIGSRGKAVISTRKIGKSPHRALALFPNEPEIDKAGAIRWTVEVKATPELAVRFRVGSLRNTHNDTLCIFQVPCYTAVWSAECVEVRYRTVSPQSSVPAQVIRQSGIACHPGLVIDAVSSTARPAKPGEVRHLVLLFCLYLR